MQTDLLQSNLIDFEIEEVDFLRLEKEGADFEAKCLEPRRIFKNKPFGLGVQTKTIKDFKPWTNYQRFRVKRIKPSCNGR